MPRAFASEPQTPEYVFHPWVLWLGILWGFAEATLFFIVPDVLLTLIALFSFRRSTRVLGCILVGAVAGGAVMYLGGAKAPAQAKALVLQVPFVSLPMFERTQVSFQRSGIWALTKRPGNGIPYKDLRGAKQSIFRIASLSAHQLAGANRAVCPFLVDQRSFWILLP